MNKQVYWYKRIIHECPVCGRVDEYRERQYNDKPDNPWDRIEHEHVYDHCMEVDYLIGLLD